MTIIMKTLKVMQKTQRLMQNMKKT